MSLKPVFLLLFIFLVSFIGYRLRVLSASGAIVAILIGVLIALGFGLPGLLLIGAFFASSSLLSTYQSSEKTAAAELHEKSDVRDGWQVLANGGVAALAALLYFIFPSPLFTCAFLIVIASSTADTWASEIGVLSKEKPIMIKGFYRVERGTSGAVSILGTAMAFLGAGLIAFFGLLFFKEVDTTLFLYVFFFGFLGNVFDTLFGAFSQVNYQCKQCGLVTERLLHCNEGTVKIKGRTYMNNEAVNFLSGFLVSVIGSFIYFLMN